MNKKPMQKALGPQGCSRLESISALAHQKVSQSASGRALGPALNTNLKPRARQGSANDPQSIAARVRRERISERLKVLQALIPNGDKVDMVTMLEKAITYVQCLELQIKMLKNDSIWPKALGPLPNTLQELLELAGPEFSGTESKNVEEPPAKPKKSAPDVIEFDGNQPSADKE
nr:Rhd6-like 2 [Physcomitrium patens]